MTYYIVIDGTAEDVTRDGAVLYYTGRGGWSIHPEHAARFTTSTEAARVAGDLMRDYLNRYGPEDAGHVVAVAIEPERTEWGSFWVASAI